MFEKVVNRWNSPLLLVVLAVIISTTLCEDTKQTVGVVGANQKNATSAATAGATVATGAGAGAAAATGAAAAAGAAAGAKPAKTSEVGTAVEDQKKKPKSETGDVAVQPKIPDEGETKAKADGSETESEESSNFMIYFITSSIVIVVLYIAYHKRQRILAYIVEGGRSSVGRRRNVSSSTPEYRKLNTAEEGTV